MTQLKKLRRLPATFKAKVKAIHGKVYAAAFYGVEVAEVIPQKVAKMTAAVIKAFGRRTIATMQTGSSRQPQMMCMRWIRWCKS